MTRAEERTGLVFAALCAVNAAFVPAVAKLTTDRADALFVAAATTLCAGAAALAVLTLRSELALLVDARIGPRLLLVGAVGTGAAFWFLFEGARRATAIQTVLCLQIEPAYALVAAWAVLGERPSARRLGAIILVLGGIALALRAGSTFSPAGVWLLLATPLCWQVSHLIVLRTLRGVPPRVLTGARYVYGGIVLGAFWALRGATVGLVPGTTLPSVVPALVLQGIVLSYLGTMMWYEAITRLDLARTTAIVVPSVPLLSLVATFVLLREVPTLLQAVGMAVAAVGVLGFVTAPHAVSTRERAPVWIAPLATPEAPGDE